MAVANLHADPHRLCEFIGRDEIDATRQHCSRIKIFLPAHYDLASIPLNLQDIKWRSRGHSEALALADGEIMNACVLTNHATIGRHYLACGVGKLVPLLSEI